MSPRFPEKPEEVGNLPGHHLPPVVPTNPKSDTGRVGVNRSLRSANLESRPPRGAGRAGENLGSYTQPDTRAHGRGPAARRCSSATRPTHLTPSEEQVTLHVCPPAWPFDRDHPPVFLTFHCHADLPKLLRASVNEAVTSSSRRYRPPVYIACRVRFEGSTKKIARNRWKLEPRDIDSVVLVYR